jgi:hypothetical protein
VIDTELGPGALRFADEPDVAKCREKAIVLRLSAAEVATCRRSAPCGSPAADPRTTSRHVPNDEDPAETGSSRTRLSWAIQDSNLGPLPYQRSALTD